MNGSKAYRQHLQGGVVRTDDSNLTHKVFHSMYVILVKLRDDKGKVPFFYDWHLSKMPPVLPSIPVHEFLDPVPIWH